ncbi:MAG TPA: hypothetical protein VFE62_00885 [Gemmataceae bacterium]|nr:hypothetical protein [Gemmataceae bacterium]
MKLRLLAFAAIVVAAVCVLHPAGAEGILKKHHAPPACEPGFKMVAETVMQPVTRTVCRMVDEPKKKWVYDWIDDPFCIKDHKLGTCPNCKGPYCRKLLVKREIELPCLQQKCVTETITEMVPVVVYKKVPCDEPRAEVLSVKPMPAKK